MQRIKSGDGYFDIQMSLEEQSLILFGLESALAQIDLFNDPFDPIHPKEFETAINIFKSGTKTGEKDIVIRQLLFPFMDTETILLRLFHYVKSGHMKVTGLDLEKFKTLVASFSKLLPKGDVPPHLYPKEYRESVFPGNVKQKHRS